MLKRLAWMTVLIVTLAQAGAIRAQPVSDSDFIAIEPPEITVLVGPAGEQFHTSVMVDNSTLIGVIALPFTFAGVSELDIDTTVFTPPDIVGVTYGPAGRNPAWTIKTSLVDNDSNTILMGFISFSAFPPSADTLCYVHFAVDSLTASADVPLDSTALPPANHLVFTSAITSDEYTPTWSPGLMRLITFLGLPGDLDCDGEVTIGDIIYLVNHLFKNGPEPCVPELADIDCDGQLNLADVIWLVNYLFRGGPEPLPPCS